MERQFRQVLSDVLTADMKARIARQYGLKPGQDPVEAFHAVLTRLASEHPVQPTAEEAAKARKHIAQLAGLRFLEKEYP